MIETQKNKTKKYMIEQILLDINEIPLVYLKTLQSIVHSFKENIVAIQPQQKPTSVADTTEEATDFDWDSLLTDIHANRQKNNLTIQNRLQELTD